jgi:hypothetical protein
MLTLTFAPDGATAWSAGLVLCNTSRSITELNVEFNHQRSISIEQLATALGSGNAALAQDFANWRNTLALSVRRGVDFSNAAFADPEAALAFALQQPASFATTGALQIKLQGVTTNVTLYLLNVAVQAIQLPQGGWLGIAPEFRYTFNGGLISGTSPY